ncbi:hypothetical protein SRHO_G00018700 [Serrasalmus rhombeus]
MLGCHCEKILLVFTNLELLHLDFARRKILQILPPLSLQRLSEHWFSGNGWKKAVSIHHVLQRWKEKRENMPDHVLTQLGLGDC